MLDTQDMALLDAVKKNDPAGIEKALRNGADIDCRDIYFYTPLIWAAREGHAKALKCLIDANADLNTQNEYGETALIFATTTRHTDCAKILIAHGAALDVKTIMSGCTALMWAVHRDDAVLVDALIAAGADLDLADHGGSTALVWAAQQNNRRMIAKLLAAGADPDAANPDKTARYEAVFAAVAADTRREKAQKQGNLRNYIKRHKPGR